jgi:hypothetical protein
MKVAFVLNMLFMSSCSGFAPMSTTTTTSSQQRMTALQASADNNNDNTNNTNTNNYKAAAAGLLLGVSLLAAPMASLAETSLDFSLPKYDPSMSGFGDGNEARLYDKREMTDPGANEREKQAESMRKAEAARKERITKEKAVAKLREDEARQRNKDKKARDAERLKDIWAN